MEDDNQQGIGPSGEGSVSAKSSRGISNKTLISLIVVVSILVIGAGVLAYNNYSQNKKDDKVVASVAPSALASLEVKTPVSDKIEDEGVTWTAPKKIDDQGLFSKANNDSSYSSTDYYQVGTTSSGGDIIVAVINVDGLMVSQPIHLIIKNGDSYKRITQNSYDIDYSIYNSDKKLGEDSSFVFKSLLADKVITKGKTELVSTQYPKFVPENNSKLETKKIASTKWGDLYLEKSTSFSANDANQTNTDKTPVVTVSRYFVKLNDSTEITYEPRPTFLRDDNTFDLSYKVSGQSSSKYEKFETGGCGLGFGYFPMMVDSDSIADKVVFGESDSSQVFAITNQDNKSLIYAYELYKSDNGENKKDIATFAKDYPLLYWIDDYGSPIGYLKSDYKPATECGKPVVYLYPTTQTPFKVAVGADITKSEPTYDNGWSGVANPNGELSVKGQTFPYLFWEGRGLGVYPKVNFGRLVSTQNAKAEISSDLKKMSLSDKEIADFNNFWLPKMPSSKYIRLSWLTNSDLDKLAPLSISPKPDSVIRVFLDFAGYNEPISLNSQTLPKFTRTGFTAVEWGGLLKK